MNFYRNNKIGIDSEHLIKTQSVNLIESII